MGHGVGVRAQRARAKAQKAKSASAARRRGGKAAGKPEQRKNNRQPGARQEEGGGARGARGMQCARARARMRAQRLSISTSPYSNRHDIASQVQRRCKVRQQKAVWGGISTQRTIQHRKHARVQQTQSWSSLASNATLRACTFTDDPSARLRHAHRPSRGSSSGGAEVVVVGKGGGGGRTEIVVWYSGIVGR